MTLHSLLSVTFDKEYAEKIKQLIILCIYKGMKYVSKSAYLNGFYGQWQLKDTCELCKKCEI